MSVMTEIRNLLYEIPVRQLSELIKDEQPQTLAVILSLLRPEKSKQVMLKLPDSLHAELYVRIGHMGPVSRATLQAVLKIVTSRSRVFDQAETIGGKEFLSQVLGRMPPECRDRLIERIREIDEELASDIADGIEIESKYAQLRAMWSPKPENVNDDRLERMKETMNRINNAIADLATLSKQSSSDPEIKD